MVPGWLSGGMGKHMHMLLCGVGGTGSIPGLLPICSRVFPVSLPGFLSVSTVNKVAEAKKQPVRSFLKNMDRYTSRLILLKVTQLLSRNKQKACERKQAVQ